MAGKMYNKFRVLYFDHMKRLQNIALILIKILRAITLIFFVYMI